jgi:hypothetical protein
MSADSMFSDPPEPLQLVQMAAQGSWGGPSYSYRGARPFQPGLGFIRRNVTCASGGSFGPGPGTA